MSHDSAPGSCVSYSFLAYVHDLLAMRTTSLRLGLDLGLGLDLFNHRVITRNQRHADAIVYPTLVIRANGGCSWGGGAREQGPDDGFEPSNHAPLAVTKVRSSPRPGGHPKPGNEDSFRDIEEEVTSSRRQVCSELLTRRSAFGQTAQS